MSNTQGFVGFCDFGQNICFGAFYFVLGVFHICFEKVNIIQLSENIVFRDFITFGKEDFANNPTSREGYICVLGGFKSSFGNNGCICRYWGKSCLFGCSGGFCTTSCEQCDREDQKGKKGVSFHGEFLLFFGLSTGDSHLRSDYHLIFYTLQSFTQIIARSCTNKSSIEYARS